MLLVNLFRWVPGTLALALLGGLRAQESLPEEFIAAALASPRWEAECFDYEELAPQIHAITSLDEPPTRWIVARLGRARIAAVSIAAAVPAAGGDAAWSRAALEKALRWVAHRSSGALSVALLRPDDAAQRFLRERGWGCAIAAGKRAPRAQVLWLPGAGLLEDPRELSLVRAFARRGGGILSGPWGALCLPGLRETFLVDLERIAPCPERPLDISSPQGRLSVPAALRRWRALAPERVPAAPGAESFPGACPADAPRGRRRVLLPCRGRGGWLSSGLYAPPGEVVQIRKLRGAAALAGVRIGCHSDKLWKLATWKRWPEISWRRKLGGKLTRIASPFGGLIFFDNPRGEAVAQVEITGAIEAPRYVLAEPSSRASWPQRRLAPAPWAELESRHLIITIPSAAVRALDDPAPLLRWWDRVLVCYPELRREPSADHPQRFVADVQISAGYMHSGYPVMTHLDVATPRGAGGLAPVLDLERLAREGSWGYFHELGHNHQRGEWTFAGTGEVTCNLFTLFIMDRIVGIAPWDHPWLAGGRAKAAEYFASGAPFERWKRDPGLALVMYAELQAAFGWEAYQRVFERYLQLPRGRRPRDDAAKRDLWMVLFSQVVGRNLGPFFERWGVPVSAGARAKISSLKPWLPEDPPVRLRWR